MELPETTLSKRVDPALTVIAKGMGVIWVLLMAVIVINVIARYAFSVGRIEFEELQWHLYSIGFMLALGYGLIADAHIRVDVFHSRLSHRMQVWVDFYGIVLFVIPFSLVILWYGWDFLVYSFSIGEISASPGGLPFRWFIKSMLVIGFGLLLIAAVSRLSRLTSALFDRGS